LTVLQKLSPPIFGIDIELKGSRRTQEAQSEADHIRNDHGKELVGEVDVGGLASWVLNGYHDNRACNAGQRLRIQLSVLCSCSFGCQVTRELI
jgi:hypothetical protein